MPQAEQRLRLPAVRGLFAAAGSLAVMASLSGLLQGHHWLLDLAIHFTPYTALVLAVAALTEVLCGGRRLAAVFLVCFAWQATIVAPYYWPREPSQVTGRELRVLSFNVLSGNGEHLPSIDYILRSRADILALLEVDERWQNSLAALHSVYPHRLIEARPDNFGMAVYSRFPLDDVQLHIDPDGDFPELRVAVSIGSQTLKVVVIHPPPPVSAHFSELRNNYLDGLAETLLDQPDPLLVLGDFNTTPWSREFRALTRAARLNDCALGQGIHPSWPTTLRFGRIPIDHCLYRGDLDIKTLTAGPELGSDHLPILVRLNLQPE